MLVLIIFYVFREMVTTVSILIRALLMLTVVANLNARVGVRLQHQQSLNYLSPNANAATAARYVAK